MHMLLYTGSGRSGELSRVENRGTLGLHIGRLLKIQHKNIEESSLHRYTIDDNIVLLTFLSKYSHRPLITDKFV